MRSSKISVSIYSSSDNGAVFLCSVRGRTESSQQLVVQSSFSKIILLSNYTVRAFLDGKCMIK